MAYVDWLDGLLGRGAASLSAAFRRQQAHYVRNRQREDGGFGGPTGPSDIYYTDFALRILTLLHPCDSDFERTARFLSDAAGSPVDIVDCLSMLNCARLLTMRDGPLEIGTEPILTTMQRQLLADGGFSRPGGSGISAYHTFLAALCYEILGRRFPRRRDAARRIAALQGAGGGFAEQSSHTIEQTNATAAAICFLLMADRSTENSDIIDRGVRFLSSMQAADGGVCAHPDVPVGDLLSTFTALVTLTAAGRVLSVDLRALAGFVKATAVSNGGFRPSLTAETADVEYTYYGIGCLCLLRAAVSSGDEADTLPGYSPS